MVTRTDQTSYRLWKAKMWRTETADHVTFAKHVGCKREKLYSQMLREIHCANCIIAHQSAINRHMNLIRTSLRKTIFQTKMFNFRYLILITILLLLSSSLSPLYRVFIHIFLRQTMSLRNTAFQLFCHYYLWCLHH